MNAGTVADLLRSSGIVPMPEVSRVAIPTRYTSVTLEPASLMGVTGVTGVPGRKDEIHWQLTEQESETGAGAAGASGDAFARSGGLDRLRRAAIDACMDPYLVLALDDADAEDLEHLPVETLRAYSMALVCTHDRNSGRVPEGWTHVASCIRCGPIWLWKPMQVQGCPWCSNRVAGRPVPNPGSSPAVSDTGRRGAHAD